MNTASFVTASATVTRVTELKKGDVYKRLNDDSYSSDDKLRIGIVTDVLFNGTDAVVQTMEFTKSYREIKTTFEVFYNDKEFKVFPATQEEVKQYLQDCVESIESEISSKEKELEEAKEKLVKASEIVNGTLVKKLTTPTISNEPIAIEA